MKENYPHLLNNAIVILYKDFGHELSIHGDFNERTIPIRQCQRGLQGQYIF